MKTLKRKLKNLQHEYSELLENLEKQDEIKAKGSLHIVNRNNSKTARYYQYVMDENTQVKKARYIKKDEMKVAYDLAQAAYNRETKKFLRNLLRILKKIEKNFVATDIDEIYLNLTEARKRLVEPIRPTRDQKLTQWYKEPHRRLSYKEEFKLFATNSGNFVRSKTEKILADRFDQLGIKFKYECSLYLRDGRQVYPDFTFLDRNREKEIYWEHFGMMDSLEYAQNAIEKIYLYERNGIYLGDRLIVTFETASRPIDPIIIDKKIERYLM